MSERQQILGVIAGMAGLTIAALLALGLLLPGGGPSLVAPLPVVFMIPIFAYQLVGAITSIAAVPIAFCLCCIPLLRGRYKPLAATVLFGLLTVASISWYVLSWQYGMKWQGAAYTWGCLTLSALLGVYAAVRVVASWRHPGFKTTLVANWLVFLWLATYAFPYLGETP